jgi:parallel beta-helix repeat protein
LGEWAYNSGSHKITMYFGSAGPSSHNVRVSSIENLVTIAGKSYIVFDNLALSGANTESFFIQDCNNIKINACDISFSGHDAINSNSGSSTFTVTNNNISYSNFNAILGGNSSNWTITGNTITNTASVAGMGGSGEGQYNAIMTVVSSNISQNKITSTGYMPLTFSGANNTIQNNYIDTYCFVKDDGGGIYCGAQNLSGTRILNNIVLNGKGALTGTPEQGTGDGRTIGIYIDDGSSNAEIAGNTIAFCQQSGIYTHNSHDLNIHDNTVFDNGSAAMKYYNDGNTIKNITLTGNIFFAKTASQYVCASSGGTLGPTTFFSSADKNYWCRPLNESNTFQVLVPSVAVYNLSTWKSLLGKEPNSKSSPITFSDVNRIRFEYNATTSSKTVSLGANYIDPKGTTYAGSITLAPFTSAILMNTAGSTTEAAVSAEVVDPSTLNLQSSLVIYPNPVRDNFVLQVNNSQTGSMNVQLINQAGALVRSFALNKEEISTQVTLPANNLPAGVYFVHVQIGNWSDKRKIVKL